MTLLSGDPCFKTWVISFPGLQLGSFLIDFSIKHAYLYMKLRNKHLTMALFSYDCTPNMMILSWNFTMFTSVVPHAGRWKADGLGCNYKVIPSID